MVDTYVPTHLKPYKRPDSYFGATWEGWYPVLEQNRDSDCLTRSNYRVALAQLLEFDSADEDGNSTVTNTRAWHFACGWVETIYVHSSNVGALVEADEILRSLEEYAVLDEEDWGNLELEEAEKVWNSFDRRDRIDACSRFDVSIYAARRDEVPQDDSGMLVSWLAQ